MSRLVGKVALVTGAGTGIGKGVALRLAQEGAAVAVHYASNRRGAEEAVQQIRENGGRAVAIQADTSRVSEVRRLVDEATRALGTIGILVNNSGVTLTDPFLQFSEEKYDQVFGINVKGTFFCAQAVVPGMRQLGGGVIVNMSSVHGYAGFPGHTAYAATKGAINALTRDLAVELGPLNIRVNTIAPGAIEVERYATIPGYTPERWGREIALGRVGYPPDIAGVVAFLCSDDAAYVTGQIIYVDGGLTVRMPFLVEKQLEMKP